MQRVLVDTSVWSDFFRKKTHPSSWEDFKAELADGSIVTSRIIVAEILSANLGSLRVEVADALSAVASFDLDLNSNENWDAIADLAVAAYKKKLRPCGIVDRLLILTAQKNALALSTLDEAMAELAQSAGIRLVNDWG